MSAGDDTAPPAVPDTATVREAAFKLLHALSPMRTKVPHAVVSAEERLRAALARDVPAGPKSLPSVVRGCANAVVDAWADWSGDAAEVEYLSEAIEILRLELARDVPAPTDRLLGLVQKWRRQADHERPAAEEAADSWWAGGLHGAADDLRAVIDELEHDVPAPTDEPTTEARIRELYEAKYPCSVDTEDDLLEIQASIDTLRTLGLVVVPSVDVTDRAAEHDPRPQLRTVVAELSGLLDRAMNHGIGVEYIAARRETYMADLARAEAAWESGSDRAGTAPTGEPPAGLPATLASVDDVAAVCRESKLHTVLSEVGTPYWITLDHSVRVEPRFGGPDDVWTGVEVHAPDWWASCGSHTPAAVLVAAIEAARSAS